MNRVFVALSLPEEVSDRLMDMQSGVHAARWIPADNFHVTLAFLGKADNRALDDIHLALAGVDAPAFEMTLAGCGAFGGAEARSLWAGVEANPALSHLQARIVTALTRAGHPPERTQFGVRKFTPHVTLAYLKRAEPQNVADWRAAHNLFRAGPIEVGAFHLYASHLGSTGAHYEIMESYSLGDYRSSFSM